MVLDGGWLAIVKVSTYTPVLHLLGWGHIDSLTHQVLYDCHIHKKLFNLNQSSFHKHDKWKIRIYSFTVIFINSQSKTTCNY